MPGDGSASLRPTRMYAMFANVKAMGGKTVGEYLTGRMMPVMAMEDYLWSRFDMATARLQQQGKRGKGGRR